MPLILPNTIANEQDADGDKLQQNFETIADYVNQDVITSDGSTAMTDPLLLPGLPTQPNQASTKQYVDDSTTSTKAYADSAATTAAAAVITALGISKIAAGNQNLVGDATGAAQLHHNLGVAPKAILMQINFIGASPVQSVHLSTPIDNNSRWVRLVKSDGTSAVSQTVNVHYIALA